MSEDNGSSVEPTRSSFLGQRYSRRQVLRGGAAAGAAGLAIGGGAFALTSCGSDEDEAAGGKVGLLYDMGYGGIPGSMGQYFGELIKRAADRGLEVSGTEVALDDLGVRIEAAHAAMKGPDLETFFANYSAYEFLAQGAIQALDPHVGGRAEIDHWSFTTQLFDGKMYHCPFFAEISMLCVNREIFNNAGVELDDRFSSWDSMISDLQKVKASGKTPIMMGSADGFNSEKWCMALEMGFMDKPTDLTQWNLGMIDIDHPVASGWIDQLAQLIGDGLVNDDAAAITEQQAMERFTSGEAAMMMLYPGAVFALDESKFDVMGYWKGPGAASAPMAAAGTGIVMTSFAENPEGAGELLKFLHEPAQLKMFNEITGELPCDDRFDASGLGPMAAKTWDLMNGDPAPFWVHDFMHFDVIFSIVYPMSQEVVAGISAKDVKAHYDREVKAWRDGNPDAMVRAQGFFDITTDFG